VQKTYSGTETAHQPVLLKETLEHLSLKPGQVAVDCTLGLGGHASEILKAIGPKGFLYAFERDERNLKLAEKRLSAIGKNFKIFHDSFSSLKDRLRGEGVSLVDAILFDLGLSSPHVDDADRGFSFLKEGPLDMRFDASSGKTAADLLNSSTEEELADIFYHYGEERFSRKLAKAVVLDRKKEPFHSTTQFAAFVERVLGRGKPGYHRATQIFQALRIAVNEELMALELGLNQAIELLAPHGRVVVLSYHSLEDRFVKQTFKQLATDLRDPNDIYGRRVLRSKSLSLLNKKPIRPSDEEVKSNSRARSALLRAAQKS
jgi:16S rRNA (cytosine1402-N4)-methyltransferase